MSYSLHLRVCSPSLPLIHSWRLIKLSSLSYRLWNAFFPRKAVSPFYKQNFILEGKKKKKPAALHNLSQKPYSFSTRTWKGPTFHERSRKLLSPRGTLVIFIQIDPICTAEPPRFSSCRVRFGARQLKLLSLSGSAEQKASKPRTELSVCKALLFFQNLSYAPSPPATEAQTNEHLVCFMPWRPFPIKRWESAWGHWQGLTLSTCELLASDPRGREGRVRMDPGPQCPFRVPAIFLASEYF